jgi:hypothetical protein
MPHLVGGVKCFFEGSFIAFVSTRWDLFNIWLSGSMDKEHAHVQELECNVLSLTAFCMEDPILAAGPFGWPVFQRGVQPALRITILPMPNNYSP